MSLLVASTVFVISAVLVGLAVDVVRRAAPRLHLVDVPNERSLHSQPTPRAGGFAIVVASLAVVTFTAVFGPRANLPEITGYATGALAIAAVSLLDDIRSISIPIRLAVQIAGALVASSLVLFTRQELHLSEPARLALLVAATVATVGLVNTYNFMDGIDGLAGTQAVVAGLAWALLATLSHNVWLAALSIVVAGSSLGFLFSNWSPARIFMGDVGSAFLGFTFAFLVVADAQNVAQVVGGVLIMWPMLFDESVTMSRRLIRRENVFAAHRTHLYQKMVLRGTQPARVAALYALFALVAAVSGTLLWIGSQVWLEFVSIVLLVVVSFAVLRLAGARSQGTGSIAASSERGG